MGTYVTTAGLQIPTVETIQAEITTDQRSLVDPDLENTADDPLGAVNGIFASHLREAWEAVQVAFDGLNPDASEDSQLDAISAITGTAREAATPSKFRGLRRIELTLEAGASVPIGTLFHVAGDITRQFKSTEQADAVGAGVYVVAAECTVLGPTPCNAGTLTVIATPVVGLVSVNNAFDVELGTNEDTNHQLRLRRERELRASGLATVPAIQAKLLAYENEDGENPILDATVFENYTDTTNLDGLPPHSLECLVYDGVSLAVPDDTIAELIWTSKPGGIQLIGTSSGTITDSNGETRIIPFSRPDLREIIIYLEVLLEDSTIPGDYTDAITASVVSAFATRVRPGKTIRCNHYEKAAIDVAGVEDCLAKVGFADVGLLGFGVNLDLDPREMGYVQIAGITIVYT
jgi:hypothetical protein